MITQRLGDHSRRTVASVVVVLALVVGCAAAAPQDAASLGAGEDPSGEVRQIGDLENVETSLHALGSVWAVTSNRNDRFSQEPLQAGVVQIDPSTLEVRRVLDSLTVEPTFSVLDDQLWVRLADRVVALDSTGNQISAIEIPFGESGDLVAAGGHLWLIDFSDATVTIVDPATRQVVRVIATGMSPAVPIAAFDHVWIPNITDGTVTIIDINSLGATVVRESFVSATRLEDVTAVADGITGDEVWVTTENGDVLAITADGPNFGEVREIDIEPDINRIHVIDERAFLLPISGRDIFAFDIRANEMITRIPTSSIPFRAMVHNGIVWVSEDGMSETLIAIDAQTLEIQAEYSIGSNSSNTNGPHRPFAVGDEIWIPNRGDNAMFIVETRGG